MKKLITTILTLTFLSFTNQASAVEQKTFYYPTGEVGQVQEIVNGKASKVTYYHKTSEVKEINEFIDGKPLKATVYHKTGKVKQVQDYVNGKVSKNNPLSQDW